MPESEIEISTDAVTSEEKAGAGDSEPEMVDVEGDVIDIQRGIEESLDLGVLTSEIPDRFWPRIEPQNVSVPVAGREFVLAIGIGAESQLDVSGPEIFRPSFVHGAYDIDVQIVAPGFKPRDGKSLTVTLAVTAAEHYPSVEVHLTPDDQDEDVVKRSIRVIYSVGGAVIGIAARSISVARTDQLAATTPPPPPLGPSDMDPLAAVSADLTIIVLQKRGAPGDLQWSFRSRHSGVSIPAAPIEHAISDPEEFARGLIDGVKYREDEDAANLYSSILGRAVDVRDAMPSKVWGLLREVGKLVEGPPVVYILSQEPYIPWEIAATVEVMDPPLVAEAPPFLGAQAIVSRWVYREDPTEDIETHRLVQPPLEIDIHNMAVIRGLYEGDPDWSRLTAAEAEADDLDRLYSAQVLDADSATVRRCLKDGIPSADLVHFAVHGKWEKGSVREGVVLMNGNFLDDSTIVGYLPLPERPFVFLNACQVGQADQVLGQYSGIAAAFLRAGARGVVAPLWSVDDQIAREIALRFYERVCEGGMTPAEFFRLERSSFRDEPELSSATALAYLFYGHPSLRLKGLERVTP